MAITGTGHNGITTFSLENGTLTIVGPGGTFEAHADEFTNDHGIIKHFNPLIGCAQVEFPAFGKTEVKNIPFGELNLREDARVSDSIEPVHPA